MYELKISVLINLAEVLVAKGGRHITEAVKHLEEAVELVELRRGVALSLDSRSQVMTQHAALYNRLAWLKAVRQNKVGEALEVAEAGKNRLLADCVLLAEGSSITAPDLSEAFWGQLQTLDRLQRSGIEGVRSSEYAQAVRKVVDLREALRQADPDYAPSMKPIKLEAMRAIAAEAQATIVFFLLSEEDTLIFQVHPDGELDFTPAYAYGQAKLSEDFGRLWATPYQSFLEAYETWRAEDDATNESRYLQAQAHWLSSQSQMMAIIEEKFMAKIREKLGSKGVQKIILIPHRELSVLPLHAAWCREDNRDRFFIDDFDVRYAPSFTMIERLLVRDRRDISSHEGLALLNPIPPGGLEHAFEVIPHLKTLLTRLVTKRGTGARGFHLFESTRNASLIHLACHGKYDSEKPLESSFEFSAGPDYPTLTEEVTLADLLQDLEIPHAWHVTLSACETNLIDYRQVSGDHLGLALGFLLKGAASVWGSMWAVDHQASASLMNHAYAFLAAGTSKAEALRKAQLALRRSRPEYAHPFYWAGFQYLGA